MSSSGILKKNSSSVEPLVKDTSSAKVALGGLCSSSYMMDLRTSSDRVYLVAEKLVPKPAFLSESYQWPLSSISDGFHYKDWIRVTFRYDSMYSLLEYLIGG